MPNKKVRIARTAINQSNEDQGNCKRLNFNSTKPKTKDQTKTKTLPGDKKSAFFLKPENKNIKKIRRQIKVIIGMLY